MAKAFNPFEHHHHHHHDDHEESYEQMDAAQRSLADALRVSFFILKIVMAVLIIAYLLSGVFIVESGKVAVVLRFGDVVGEGEGAIIESGKMNFALPFPIDEVIKIPTNKRTFMLSSEFWYARANESGETAAARAGPLNPITHGSMITGDANIVHGQWTVEYSISNPIDFITTLADPATADLGDQYQNLEKEEKMMLMAERTIRAVAEEAIVYAIARREADEVIRQRLAVALAEAQVQAQQTLDDMECGVKLEAFRLEDTAMPLSVQDAYKQVIRATNEADQAVNQARKQAAEILVGAAGEAHDELWRMMKQYELATEAAEAADAQQVAEAKQRLADLEARFAQAFAEKRLRVGEDRYVTIGGDVARIVNEAESFRSTILAEAERDARNFKKLLADYNANPRIFASREWQNVREKIFEDWTRVERIEIPQSRPWIKINRDPGLKKRRAEDEIRRESEAARQGG